MKDKLLYLIFIVIKKIANLLPPKICYDIFKGLGSLANHLVGKKKKRAVNNLTRTLAISEEQAEEVAKGVFQDAGLKLSEILGLEAWQREDFKKRITVEGFHHFEEAYQQEDGVILFTGHLGNWEILGMYFAALGYPLNALAKNQKNNIFNRELLKIRTSRGANVFDIGTKGVARAYKSLLKGELLLILGDQDARETGIFVDFFGQPASTPQGPVVLAKKAGSAILPVYLVREGLNQYRLIIEEPMYVSQEADEQELKEKLQQLTSSLEGMIREYPKQWGWFYKRWRTKKH
ncbi:lysophospholipid acyltransferase family protein [Natroniella acetigena]|uniref:lysophospholipid acyltransferase family protein n=1 Tax=Natroniella acetigena TaxID=52004 RepID=UPI00200AEE5E|nr:lysophospholipid acyltransferase family protein [Natroniella acetigena]MCK8827320.1 lysophospholipid acyltransferase family protein [Natroniella acetigena]